MDKTERLGNGICAVVSPEHTFGTDALLLAAFAQVRKQDIPLDMGTGCGIIPLLWCRNPWPAKIACLDMQSAAVEQVQRAIISNRLADRLQVHQLDLRRIKTVIPNESVTLVTMNPPYQQSDAGIPSASKSDLIARHETECTLLDACTAAKYVLKYGGRFCICHRPDRLTDAICAMRQSGLEPKRLRFAADRAGQSPFLVMLEGRKGGKSGIQIEPVLIVREADGSATPEMRAIYGPYAEEHQK